MRRIELVSGLPLRSDNRCTGARAKELFGRHTVGHPVLTLVGDEQVREEVAKSERWLEVIIVKPLLALFFRIGRTGTMRRALGQW
jgi:hypothetical protein